MSNVIKFPRHKKMRCPTECGACNTCVLYSCVTCHGAEASLPTHCPGEPMDEVRQMLVQQRYLDFKDGQWTRDVVGDKTKRQITIDAPTVRDVVFGYRSDQYIIDDPFKENK